MDTLVEALLDSPLLPRHVEHLNRVLAVERSRRKRFYKEITEGDKWEFINGEVVMHSPVKWCHAEVLSYLSRLLSTYACIHHLGTVVTEKAMVSLTRNDYEPDVCFFRQETVGTFASDQMQFPAPALIAEILSPSTARDDRGIKKRDYAAHGVAEYWIVDPVAQTVEQHTLHGEDYQLAGLRNGGDEIASLAVTGFRVPVRALFERQANVAALTSLLANLPLDLSAYADNVSTVNKPPRT